MMDECRVVINCLPTLFHLGYYRTQRLVTDLLPHRWVITELRREGRKSLPYFLDRVLTATESKKELERARDSQVTLIFG